MSDILNSVLINEKEFLFFLKSLNLRITSYYLLMPEVQEYWPCTILLERKDFTPRSESNARR